MSRLLQGVELLLADLERIGGPTVAAEAAAARQRLGDPLRVAIAGRLKAGKSTFINALAGTAIAPTGVTECTRLVTWYRHGPTARAVGVDAAGARHELPYRQDRGGAHIDLEGAPGELERIEVELPLPLLETLTVIDTPGTLSISEQLSARALDHLLQADFGSAADVVVYLLRHLHEEDVAFLEQFRQVAPDEGDPLRALGVLSRADEIGNGRGDSLEVAGHHARHLAGELSTLVASVHPVAGLLAQAAATVDDDDLGDLRRIARAPGSVVDDLLRSATSFVAPHPAVAVSPERRVRLIEHLGLFGLRSVIPAISTRSVADVEQLRGRLARCGGLEPIRATLLQRFARRSDVLRAARAFSEIQRLADRLDDPERERVDGLLDMLRANAIELEELALLRELFLDPRARLDAADRALVVASLGGEGTSPADRLGAPAGTPPDELRRRAVERLEQLDRITSARGRARRAVETARRSIELVAATLAAGAGRQAAT